jgi:mannose-6-phosphate isomerase-like protein (cupin superfamily)
MALTEVGCLVAGLSEEAVAVDGKAVRGTCHASGGQSVHLVAALDHRAGAVLGQDAIDGETKGTEVLDLAEQRGGQDRAGASRLLRVRELPCPPRATRACAASHRSYYEAWFIAEGTIEFLLDSRRERESAGEFVFVPRGHTHSFANPWPGQARILVIGSSPALGMVEEIGRLAKENRLTKENVADVYQRLIPN